jgi:hypothetical protein
MSSSSRKPPGGAGSAIATHARAERVVRVILSAARRAVPIGVAFMACEAAHASNWDFNPRIELAGMYNDNYRLAEDPADKIHVGGAMLNASVAVRMLTQTTEISLVPRINTLYFPSDTEDDSTNGYLDLKAIHKTLKANYGLTAQYANEEVIFSELLPADFPGVELGQIVGSESGRVTVLNRRTLERVAPTFTYDFTPREHFHFDAEYLHAQYDRNLVQQFGFNNFQAQVGLGYDVTQKVTFTGSVIGTRFEPDVGSGNTNGYGIQTQLDVHPTQIMRYYLRLGAQRSSAELTNQTVNNTSVTGGAGVSWTYQITQITVDALRGVSPSSSGAVVNHSELRFRVLRALQPRLSSFVGARGVSLRGAVGSGLTVQGSDYVAANAGLEYQLTRSYRLTGEYDYTWQRFQGEPRAAANAVTLSIIYQPYSRFERLPDLNGLPTERTQ